VVWERRRKKEKENKGGKYTINNKERKGLRK